MTILIASIFIAALIFSIHTIAASFRASLQRIFEIIENERAPMKTASNISIGAIKHYKMPIAQYGSNNIVAMPLNLTNGTRDTDLAKAA